MTVHVLPQQATTMGCVYRSSSRGLESPRQFVVGRALAWRRAVTVSWRAHGHVDVRGRCVVQKVGVKGGGFGGAGRERVRGGIGGARRRGHGISIGGDVDGNGDGGGGGGEAEDRAVRVRWDGGALSRAVAGRWQVAGRRHGAGAPAASRHRVRTLSAADPCVCLEQDNPHGPRSLAHQQETLHKGWPVDPTTHSRVKQWGTSYPEVQKRLHVSQRLSKRPLSHVLRHRLAA